ncbi:MAG: autotransporter domain-containing protein [Candidatus Omnitrophota bacterium]
MKQQTVKRSILLVISFLFIGASSVFAEPANEPLPEFGAFPNDPETSFEEFQQHIAEVDRSLDEFVKSRQEFAESQEESGKSFEEFGQQMKEVDNSLDEFDESLEAPTMETIFLDEDYQRFEEEVAGVEYESDEPTLYVVEGDFIVEHHLEIGPEYSFIKYEEPGVMEEDGTMFGISGSYWCRNRKNWICELEAKYSWGTVDYTSVNTGTMDGLEDRMFEIRGLGGYQFSPSKVVTLTPYIGIAYRYLYDDARGTSSTGANGYERESNYVYAPLGLETTLKLRDDWSIGTNLEFDIFIGGLQKSYLSQAIAGLNDVENNQYDGYGVRGSLKIQKKVARFDFLLEPFVKYWKIEESEWTTITYTGTIIGYGYEPKNKSLEYGLKCAVRY